MYINLFTNLYIFMYVYIYVYMYINIYMYIYTHIYICTHTCLYIYIYTHNTHGKRIEHLDQFLSNSVLQHVAVCCSVLQCATVCCSVLQRVAVHLDQFLSIQPCPHLASSLASSLIILLTTVYYVSQLVRTRSYLQAGFRPRVHSFV